MPRSLSGWPSCAGFTGATVKDIKTLTVLLKLPQDDEVY